MNLLKLITTLKFRRFIRTHLRQLYIFFFIKRKVKDFGVDPKSTKGIIVSLTSYPARINTVHHTIITLLTQSLKPNKIILWLTSSQFPNKENDLPDSLLQLTQYGLTINWYETNIKSHTKLLPTLEKYPNNIIVIADDDMYYRQNWLQTLYTSYTKYPQCIHTNKFRRISYTENNINPYNSWVVNDLKFMEKPSYLNFLMGVGGVLFPPKSLNSTVMNYTLCQELTPKADDIWFWAMAVLNNTKIIAINSKNKVTFERENIDNKDSLWNENSKGLNDIQLNRIITYFPNIRSKLASE